MMHMKTIRKRNFPWHLLPLTLIVLALQGCNTSVKSDSNPIISVELTKMNVLYLGVDNPVVIAAANTDPSELEVSFSPGKITGSDGNYMISPSNTGTAELTISKNGTEMGKKEFRVLALPSPTAGINVTDGGADHFISSGTIALKSLVSAGGLSAMIPDFIWDTDFKVTSFSIEISRKDIVQIVPATSDKFTDRQAQLLRQLSPGNKVVFNKIFAIGPDGLERQLNDIVLTIG